MSPVLASVAPCGETDNGDARSNRASDFWIGVLVAVLMKASKILKGKQVQFLHYPF